MKNKLIYTLMLIPLLISCGGNGDSSDVAPYVDENYTPTLPTFEDKNTGSIQEDENYVYFDFYELSDFHGATTYEKDNLKLGIERLSTYFDTKREANPGGTLLLSGGDMWQGTADSNVTRGNLVTYAMDVMDFDSMTLGNHEFDWTQKWIENNQNRATFPFLCANLTDKTTGEMASFVKASTIVTRGDYKIGIIGTIGDNIKDSILASAVENFDFASEIDTVKSESVKLKNEGCDIVVWSSHNDIAYLKNEIGSDDLGVDLIFGGHSHTTTVDVNGGVPMLETKDLGRSIAHCQLKLNKSTKEVDAVDGYDCDIDPTAVDYVPDSDVTGIYNQYKTAYIDPVKNRKLGKADGLFEKNEHLANYAVKTMYNVVEEKYKDYPIYVSFTNVNGGVRADIASGQITYGDVYASFPFDNEVVIMQTTGRKLQNCASGSGLSNFAIYQTIGSYGALDNNTNYYFVTTDYLASSTSYFANLASVVVKTELILRDLVADAIKADGTIVANNYKTSADSHFQKIS